jgi:hypothetical protein
LKSNIPTKKRDRPPNALASFQRQQQAIIIIAHATKIPEAAKVSNAQKKWINRFGDGKAHCLVPIS